MTRLLLLAMLAIGTALSVAAPPPAAPATRPASAPAAAAPQTAGFHHFYFQAKLGDEARTLAYSVYLPRQYQRGTRCPMIVYLVGLGDRGENHAGLFNNGPPVYLSASPELAQWAPFIVLAPQCPKDLRWETPAVAEMVRELIEYALQQWSVDEAQIYLTGLSNGGTGCWSIAAANPERFAAAAVFSGMDIEPHPLTEALAGTSVLIVCGSEDGRFTLASRTMRDALRIAGVDTLFVEIPQAKHSTWQPYYSSRDFYEFLLMHRRDAAPPRSRPDENDLLVMGQRVPDNADFAVTRTMHRFLPWWFVSNCGKANSPGLRRAAFGRASVLVTTPMSKEVPCRLMHTASIPAGKKTRLTMTVTAAPGGSWQLVARANGDTLLKETIASPPATQPARFPSVVWRDYAVDLTPLAGQEVYLELLNGSGGVEHPEAYWGAVELKSE